MGDHVCVRARQGAPATPMPIQPSVHDRMGRSGIRTPLGDDGFAAPRGGRRPHERHQARRRPGRTGSEGATDPKSPPANARPPRGGSGASGGGRTPPRPRTLDRRASEPRRRRASPAARDRSSPGRAPLGRRGRCGPRSSSRLPSGSAQRAPPRRHRSPGRVSGRDRPSAQHASRRVSHHQPARPTGSLRAYRGLTFAKDQDSAPHALVDALNHRRANHDRPGAEVQVVVLPSRSRSHGLIRSIPACLAEPVKRVTWGCDEVPVLGCAFWAP